MKQFAFPVGIRLLATEHENVASKLLDFGYSRGPYLAENSEYVCLLTGTDRMGVPIFYTISQEAAIHNPVIENSFSCMHYRDLEIFYALASQLREHPSYFIAKHDISGFEKGKVYARTVNGAFLAGSVRVNPSNSWIKTYLEAASAHDIYEYFGLKYSTANIAPKACKETSKWTTIDEFIESLPEPLRALFNAAKKVNDYYEANPDKKPKPAAACESGGMPFPKKDGTYIDEETKYCL